ncbi:MAG: NAD(+) synthase [Oscillospiraceae bacterium]|nr:NAD(+) synthase [Oscillospiraceae bacterium]
MEKSVFNAKQVKDEIIDWIKSYFDATGGDAKAVIGISGGKDSAIAAALCVEAVGKERVIGVLMPQGVQSDIDVSYSVCKHLGIRHHEINIGEAVNALYSPIQAVGLELNDIAVFNTPARVRMATLYAVSGIEGGRVVNTCNLSETFVGWETKYGDSAGDFSPISDLTVTEVKAIGYELALPAEFIEKTPIDGLCGKTDEDGLGFSYNTLDKYIREGICDDEHSKNRILELQVRSEHKRNPIPQFKYTGR